MTITWPWTKKVVLSRKEIRAERRRREKNARRVYATCRNCGFGAVRGVPFSNLVAVPLVDGTRAYQHQTPVVCGGFLQSLRNARALTVQNWLRANWRALLGREATASRSRSMRTASTKSVTRNRTSPDTSGSRT